MNEATALIVRSAENVHLIALANLHGEYAEVRSTDAVLSER